MLNLVTKWKKEAGMKMMETADKAVFGRSGGVDINSVNVMEGG